jgi:hypothetical protein
MGFIRKFHAAERKRGQQSREQVELAERLYPHKRKNQKREQD